MDESLHPSNLGEILDRTAQLYRTRFLVFLGISVVPTALVLIPIGGIFACLAWLGSFAGPATRSSQSSLVAAVLLVSIGVVLLPIILGATALAMAALNHAVSSAYLGEKTTIRDAYKTVWRRGWHFLWLLILEGLFIGGAPMAVWVAILAISAGVARLTHGVGSGGGVVFGLLTLLTLFALVGYVLWMLLQLSLAFPACVVEQIRAWAALKRSWSLSKGTRGRIFLLYVLASVLTWLISIAVIFPAAIIASLIPGANTPQGAQTTGVIMMIVLYSTAFAVQALIRPIYGIALTLFYYDQRIRHEGYDIERMMQAAGLNPLATPLSAGISVGVDAPPFEGGTA
jgi:hypothetical protein